MQEKRSLQLASVASMIDQFNMSNIQILQSLGYSVDVVADFSNPGNISKERAEKLKKYLVQNNAKVYDIAIPRSLNPFKIFRAYRNVKGIIEKNNYNLLHCHSPIGGAIARLAAKKKRRSGLKVIYTAHGFHFYRGAPLKNWLIYYFIEKYFSRFTDVLITINKEDYNRALNRLKAKKTVYIPGVGVDTNWFSPCESERHRYRSILNLSENRIVLLSVGELNKNKNHEAVIRALQGLDYSYIIVGQGVLFDYLKKIGEECNVDVKLLGYQNDVRGFYNAADIFVLPSLREGLNVSLMEAMASGLACAVSDIRGNVDLIDNPVFNPHKVFEIKEGILKAIDNKEILKKRNLSYISNFSKEVVEKKMKDLYQNI